MSDRKQPPHHRLTFKSVVQDYRAGLLTAKGAVFYAVAASRRLGEPVSINPHQFCKSLGMSKPTFYRVVSLLQVERRIEWAVQGDVLLWVPIREDPENPDTPEYFFWENCLKSETESLKSETESLKSETESLKFETESLKSETESLKFETEKSPEPLPDGDSSQPFLSLLSIQSLSISTEFSERELIEFENWLRRRAENLPRMPALIDEWIVKQAQKAGIQNEFRRYLKGRAKKTPVAAEFSTAIKKDDEGERASRLTVLRRWWQQGKRDSVLEWLEDNPDQGITLAEVKS